MSAQCQQYLHNIPFIQIIKPHHLPTRLTNFAEVTTIPISNIRKEGSKVIVWHLGSLWGTGGASVGCLLVTMETVFPKYCATWMAQYLTFSGVKFIAMTLYPRTRLIQEIWKKFADKFLKCLAFQQSKSTHIGGFWVNIHTNASILHE